MAKADSERVECPKCHKGHLEVRPFRFSVAHCEACGSWFRHEVTGRLTPCDERGRPIAEGSPERNCEEKEGVSQNRNQEIIERWMHDEGPTDIARDHNITRQRVSQIVGSYLMQEYRAGRLVERR